MNTQQLMKRLSRIFALIFVGMSLMYSQATFASCDEHDVKIIKELSQQVTPELPYVSFYPYIGNVYKFHPTGFQELTKYSKVLYGTISDDKATYQAAFMVTKDKVTLMYIADEVISIKRFLHLFPHAYAAAEDDQIVSEAQIYIKNVNYIAGKGGTFEWSLYTKDFIKKINFTFYPESDGGESVTSTISPKQKNT